MNILLIDPPFKRFTGLINNYYPIGLTYLAAVLRQNGYEVSIYEVDAADKPTDLDFTHEYDRYDLYLQGVNDSGHPIWQEIQRKLKDCKPDLVGITAVTPKIASALKVADLCKEYNPHIPVVMGGAHPTVSPEQSINHNAIDFIVRGEGERSFLQLVKAIGAGERNFSQINGISYCENGKIIHNLPSEFIKDLDSVPFPSRNLLMNIQNYTSEDMGCILTSRGCPFRCAYCYHPWKGKFHFRSIDNVVEEIKQVMKDYGTRQFTFKDDTFTAKRSHVMEFCERIIKEKININWDCTTRVDRIDDEMLKLMIKAGCNIIKVGVETGSQRILDETNKGITFDQVRESTRLFKKHGIFWSAYFMIGLPMETEEDIIKTYEFMKEINPFYAGLGVYEAFKQTDLFDVGVEMGLLYPDVEIEHFYRTYPKDYYFVDPRKRTTGISPERFAELSDFMTKAFDKHNVGLRKMARRGWSRRKAYMKDFGLLANDCKKALKWKLR
jgi:anaerobic magnesium-protoporphyrin IX monomethyl ester cyclase